MIILFSTTKLCAILIEIMLITRTHLQSPFVNESRPVECRLLVITRKRVAIPHMRDVDELNRQTAPTGWVAVERGFGG